MKALHDPEGVLARGLAAIREQFQVPSGFPPQVLAEAEAVAKRAFTQHADRTDWPFVTLDPASSTDLDQAFTIDADGTDLILRYAIADVAWFVDDGGALDTEAWARGETLYLPDGKAGLYPPVLAENAASLLPAGPRAAVILSVRVGPDGDARLDGAERAVIRSRAKLAYSSVSETELPAHFAEFARRLAAAEERRGAARVDPPEQEVESLGGGRFALAFRPRVVAEDRNAALSLAANLAVAQALFSHRTGLFRVMAGPDAAGVARLRQTSAAFGIDWPAATGLKDFEQTLDRRQPAHAALMLAIRRAGQGAGYAPFRAGEVPWHAAIAGTYAHATAPLRRLADRYVLRAVLAVANGEAVPELVTAAFQRLPEVMARADAVAGRIERAVVDLAETVMLRGREGEGFAAVVTDSDGKTARIQLCDLPVVARVNAPAAPGSRLSVRLERADADKRTLHFAPA